MTLGGSHTAPDWVKLQRRGARLNGYRSLDGAQWTLISTATINLAAPVYVGLAVSSQN